MLETPLVFHVGNARITRVGETSFALPPEALFPAWEEDEGAALAEELGAESLDLPGRRVPMQTHLWVVEAAGLTLVVDTGIGNGKTRPFSKLFDRLDTPLLARFRAAGFAPEAVDYVLLTHLHVDHVGWNTHWQAGRWAPVFPNATHVFSQAEADFFHTAEGEARRMVYEDSVRPIVEAGLARTVPAAGEEILDGIRFLPTPGHSIGHMAIAMAFQGRTALFSGDTMHNPLQVFRPEWNSLFCRDPEQAQASRRRLLEYAAAENATLFPAHFPETSAGRVSHHGAGYRWAYAAAEA